MAKIKGSAMEGAVRALANRRDAAEPLLAASLLRYLDETISPSGWYPEEDLVALIRALLRLIPGSREQVLEEMGRISAREHFEGTYAHLVEDRGLRNLDIRAATLWSAMHDTGEMCVTDDEPGRVRLELRGYEDPSDEVCKISQGYMLEVLRLSGIEAEAKRVSCAADGAKICIWDFHYPADTGPAPAR